MGYADTWIELESIKEELKMKTFYCSICKLNIGCDSEYVTYEGAISIHYQKIHNLLSPVLPNEDPINPSHYKRGKYEVIDVLEDWNLDPHIFTVIKYLARSKYKGNELEDLQKAKWYLDRKIMLLEWEKGKQNG